MLEKIRLTIKNSIVYSFGNVAGKLSGFILLPLFAKFLPIEEYGILGLIEILNLLLLTLAGMGLKAALMRWYWDKNHKNIQKSLFFTTYFINTINNIFFSIISFFIISKFSLLIFSVELSDTLIKLLIISNFFKLLLDMPLLLLRIQQKAEKQVIMQVIVLIITVSITYYLLAYKKFSLDGIFIGQLIANSFVFLLLIPYIIKNLKLKIETTQLIEMLKYGIPLFITGLIVIVFVLTDRYLITYFGTLNDTGTYTLAYKISNVLKLFFVASFMNSFVHVFNKNIDSKDYKQFNSKILTYFIIFVVFLGIGLILFSKEIILILSMGNVEYEKAYILIPLFVWNIIFASIVSQLILPLTKVKKTKLISLISISGAILNFSLNIILIPYFSSFGAVVATLITNFISAIIFYIYVRRHKFIKYETKKIIKVILVGLLFLGIYYLINEISILIIKLIIKTILVFSYFIILYFLNIFEEIELLRLKQAYQKWKNPKKWKENLKKLNKKE